MTDSGIARRDHRGEPWVETQGYADEASPRLSTSALAGPLLVVDVQNAFLNPFTHHIPGRIAGLIRGGAYAPLVFTRFVNIPDGPYRRFLDWHDCADAPGIEIAAPLVPWVRSGRVFEKPGYTGISDELAAFLRDGGFSRVAIAGIDTDMCVLKIAMDVFDLGIEPIILTDCCASTAGLQAHLAGLAVLSRNIGAVRLRDAGLSGGLLGAPEAG